MKRRNSPYLEELFKNADGFDMIKSRQLRKRMTPSEKLLWRRLRGKKLGVKFRSQHPIWHYVVDFYCNEKKLAIEVDGDVHEQPQVKEKDKRRTAELNRRGIRVIRFKNREVENDLDGVVKRIKNVLNAM